MPSGNILFGFLPSTFKLSNRPIDSLFVTCSGGGPESSGCTLVLRCRQQRFEKTPHNTSRLALLIWPSPPPRRPKLPSFLSVLPPTHLLCIYKPNPEPSSTAPPVQHLKPSTPLSHTLTYISSQPFRLYQIQTIHFNERRTDHRTCRGRRAI